MNCHPTRICALAAAHDVMVVPHGSSVYSYHLQFAFPNCPIAEFLNMSPNADQESWNRNTISDRNYV